METFLFREKFFCFSDEVWFVIEPGQTVGIGMWIVNGQKQCQDCKAEPKSSHQKRLIQRLNDDTESRQYKNLKQCLAGRWTKCFSPENDDQSGFCNMEQGTVIHEHVQWAFYVTGLRFKEKHIAGKLIAQDQKEQDKCWKAQDEHFTGMNVLFFMKGPDVTDQNERKQGLHQVKDGSGQNGAHSKITMTGSNVVSADQFKKYVQNSKHCQMKKCAVIQIVWALLIKKLPQNDGKNDERGNQKIGIITHKDSSCSDILLYGLLTWEAAVCPLLLCWS